MSELSIHRPLPDVDDARLRPGLRHRTRIKPTTHQQRLIERTLRTERAQQAA